MAKFNTSQNKNLLFNFTNFNLLLKIEFIRKQLFFSVKNVYSIIEKMESKSFIYKEYRVQKIG